MRHVALPGCNKACPQPGFAEIFLARSSEMIRGTEAFQVECLGALNSEKRENSSMRTFVCSFVALLTLAVSFNPAPAQTAKPKAKKTSAFSWVNPLTPDKYPGLRHATFDSAKHDTKIGYCIYLPPGYDDAKNAEKRYPVVYYLHGGRPGSETKTAALATTMDQHIRSGAVPPAIYVFPNGGHVSHYNYPQLKSWGETAFFDELLPHIDATYRTIAKRQGRAVEGFSQGGRGTARYMFKHPELFCSCAPMGGGHQNEKRVQENNGDEGAYQFEPGNNTWDLASRYAAKPQPPLNILVVVGDKDMNYQANLDWMAHLKSLEIPYQQIILPNVPHSSRLVYEQAGLKIMQFHADNFRRAAE